MKSIEEKLKYFEKTVIAQAIHDRDTLSQAFDREMKEALSEAEAMYKKEAKDKYCKDIEETRKEARLIVSAAKNQGQTALAQKRNDIINRVFELLEERLRAYTQTPDYDKFFHEKLSEAMRSGQYEGTVTIFLTRDDAEKKSDVVNRLAIKYLPGISVKVEISTEDIIGGCKLRIPASGRLIDNSIRALMDQEREQFLSWSRLAIK